MNSLRCPKNGKICDCCESDIQSIIDDLTKQEQDIKEHMIKLCNGLQDIGAKDSWLRVLLILNDLGKTEVLENVKSKLIDLLK